MLPLSWCSTLCLQVEFEINLDSASSFYKFNHAGVDTTTTGVVSVLYSLAKNPDKQEILRKEIMNILPEKSAHLTTQSLNNIPYLRAVIKEALRLNPPISGNARDAGQDLVIQGYQIPKDVS